MPADTIVTCRYCHDQIHFEDSYVTLNGDRPETYECRDEDLCRERATDRGNAESEHRAEQLALHGYEYRHWEDFR